MSEYTEVERPFLQQLADRIILMIDEAHRTQSSDLGDNLFEAFPNTTRIGFTGTPVITERFGEHIDTYRLMDAVNDGATPQILYEGKTADSALNEKHAFDEAFEYLFRDRSEEELLAFKKKYGATGDTPKSENRLNSRSTSQQDRSGHRNGERYWGQYMPCNPGAADAAAAPYPT